MYPDIYANDVDSPEDDILNAVAIEQALGALSQCDRELILMVFAYEVPQGYDGAWPPTLTEIGQFIGERFLGASIAESTVRARRDAILRKWHRPKQKIA